MSVHPVANRFGPPLLSDADGPVCESYGVRRNPAAAPVERRTIVIGTDGVVQEARGRGAADPEVSRFEMLPAWRCRPAVR